MVRSQDIGQILKELRCNLPKQNRSQEKYAELCGLSTRIINKIEDSGHINVHFNTIVKAIEPLGMTLSKIVEMAEAKRVEYKQTEEQLTLKTSKEIYQTQEHLKLINEIMNLMHLMSNKDLKILKNIVKSFTATLEESERKKDE